MPKCVGFCAIFIEYETIRKKSFDFRKITAKKAAKLCKTAKNM